IINFILTRKIQSNVDLMFKTSQMEDLLRFQKKKYDQLSESYRQSRRLIHDVKNHYFSVNEYVNHRDISGLQDYLGSAINDLESVYAKYNTGNLVIDSFLTNYEPIFNKNYTSFKASVNVDCNRIPINDYDLCVVLGNILDNALEACSKTDSDNRCFSIAIETNNNDKFIIHTENTYSSSMKTHPQKDALNHGYGLENIKKVVIDNNGFITIDASELFKINILIPIIEDNKRVNHPPHY
ncbi:MAG: GHKL domain-containing protein, partial [Lachnospiraceae bacterium]|nr:GHKL domain-containing protein [Lachnospiraceae bacterium]